MELNRSSSSTYRTHSRLSKALSLTCVLEGSHLCLNAGALPLTCLVRAHRCTTIELLKLQNHLGQLGDAIKLRIVQCVRECQTVKKNFWETKHQINQRIKIYQNSRVFSVILFYILHSVIISHQTGKWISLGSGFLGFKSLSHTVPSLSTIFAIHR